MAAGCKYVGAGEAFDRVVQNAIKQGAYLFYHEGRAAWQVVRESRINPDEDRESLTAKKLRLRRKLTELEEEGCQFVGFYDKELCVEGLREDMDVTLEELERKREQEVAALVNWKY